MSPEERCKRLFPEGWHECRDFELSKIEHHGKILGVIFTLLKKMVTDNGRSIFIGQ